MIGQMNMFDFLDPPQKLVEPPILLNIGKTVYKVIRGDIRELYVFDEKSWICGKGERGYRLKEKDGCYDCTWNRSIGVDTFTDYASAESTALSYISGHDVMIGTEIKADEVTAFRYIRGCDNREMKAFYARIGNGLLYVKEFMTYEHIISDNAKNVKKFMDQQEFKYDQPEQFEYMPEFKNMYPCRKDVNWLYAESSYSGCI